MPKLYDPLAKRRHILPAATEEELQIHLRASARAFKPPDPSRPSRRCRGELKLALRTRAAQQASPRDFQDDVQVIIGSSSQRRRGHRNSADIPASPGIGAPSSSAMGLPGLVSTSSGFPLAGSMNLEDARTFDHSDCSETRHEALCQPPICL